MQGGSEAEEIRFFRALINREVFFRRRTSALQRREAALSLIIPAVHPVFSAQQTLVKIQPLEVSYRFLYFLSIQLKIWKDTNEGNI